MDNQQVQTCIQVLDALAKGFALLPDKGTATTVEGLTCVQAQSLVIQYSLLRSSGLSHELALSTMGSMRTRS